jgi:myo-inositol catabolism protein IolS
MKKKPFGKTDLEVAAISFGGASLSGEGGGYGFGEVDESRAEELIKKSWELGINLFDTAPIYGFGLSEERLGKYLPREALVVTKGGVHWHSTKRVNMTNEPKIIEEMLHASLKRLKREQVDVYMIHWPDPRVDIRRPIEVLTKAQEQQKIRFIGLCNTNLQDLKLATSITRIDVIQSQYNAFTTQNYHDLNPWLTEHQAAFMSWGTFDKGILTGRVTPSRQYEASDARSWAPWWKDQPLEQKLKRVEKLKKYFEKHELNLEEAAIGFQLHSSTVSTMLIGWKKPQDVISSLIALKKVEEISPDIFKDLP